LLKPDCFLRPPLRDDFCARLPPVFLLEVTALRLFAALVEAPLVEPPLVEPALFEPLFVELLLVAPLLVDPVRRFGAPAVLADAPRRFAGADAPRAFALEPRFAEPAVFRLSLDFRLVARAMFGLLLRTNGNVCTNIMFLAMELTATSRSAFS
jgi:hypothetical protein